MGDIINNDELFDWIRGNPSNGHGDWNDCRMIGADRRWHVPQEPHAAIVTMIANHSGRHARCRIAPRAAKKHAGARKRRRAKPVRRAQQTTKLKKRPHTLSSSPHALD
jgi:hypothetical protein